MLRGRQRVVHSMGSIPNPAGAILSSAAWATFPRRNAVYPLA
jgi:hypothetical protein